MAAKKGGRTTGLGIVPPGLRPSIKQQISPRYIDNRRKGKRLSSVLKSATKGGGGRFKEQTK
jgi:hypothetical protein